MALSSIERETIIVTNDEEKYWEVCTSQTKIINKLEKLGIKAYKQDTMDGEVVTKYFKVPLVNIKIGKKREVNLSEEQRQEVAERMKKARESKLNENSITVE
jgi:uncharacterized protein with gpF-like domain